MSNSSGEGSKVFAESGVAKMLLVDCPSGKRMLDHLPLIGVGAGLHIPRSVCHGADCIQNTKTKVCPKKCRKHDNSLLLLMFALQTLSQHRLVQHKWQLYCWHLLAIVRGKLFWFSPANLHVLLVSKFFKLPLASPLGVLIVNIQQYVGNVPVYRFAPQH